MAKHPRLLLILLSVYLLSFVACDRRPARPTGEAGAPLLTFERSGGIAGFQDRLVLGYNGEYYLARGGQQERIGSLSEDRQAQLENWLAETAPFALRLEDNPGMPDNMVRQVVWTGAGRKPPGESQQRAILDWASNLLAELSTGGQ